MTTRLRVTYFQGGRSKQQRLLIAVNRSGSVSEARQEIQKALTSLTDAGATAIVKTLWTRDGFLLPDSHVIGVLVESGDEIYASEKKTNVAPQLPASSGSAAKVVKREREEPEDGVQEEEDDDEEENAASAAEEAPAAAGAKSKAKAEPQAKKPRKARGPSAYNLWMKTAVPRWKAENPGKTSKEAFTAVAGLWRTSSENPKNAGAKSTAPTAAVSAEDDGVTQDSDAESGGRPPRITLQFASIL